MITANLELIGKGAFTKVFKLNKKEVLFKTTCPAKYCFAEWLGGDRFYPEIRKDNDHNLIGKLYDKIRAPKKQLKSMHYRMYRHLVDLRNSNYTAQGYNELYEMFEQITYKSLRESLINALDGLSNYIDCDSIRFEISPRNIMTDKKGNLILNDVFFCSRELALVKGY